MPRVYARPVRLASSLAFAATILLALAARPAEAATIYKVDLYDPAGYERQVDSRTCTAASIAMMANFITHRDLNLEQFAILAYEQPRDALNDAVQRGSDPLGWARGATAFTASVGVPTTYAWVSYDRKNTAFRAAARSIGRFRKPVGLLTDHGRHAVVMTGFEATADPNGGGTWSLLAVYLSDPFGAHHTRYSPPKTSPFNRYWQLDATAAYDRLWYDRFVIVVPRD